MSFGNGLSGLNNSALALDVIGNNIANANTIGFKASQAHFADVFAASLSNAASRQATGLGATTSGVIQSFTQGAVRMTNNPLDVAINGGGFFRLNNAGTITFARDGQFQLMGELDATGATLTAAQRAGQNAILVNGAGLNVTGYLADYAADPAGTIVKSSTPQNIVINPNMPGALTTRMAAGVNLDDSQPPKQDALGNPAFDPTNVQTYNYATAVRSYDAAGNAHNLTMYFVKTAQPNTWQINTTRDGGKATGSVDLGALTFPLRVTSGTSDQFTIQLDGRPAVTATLPPSASGYPDATALRAGVQAAIDTAVGAGKATVSLDATNHLVVMSLTPGATSAVTLAAAAGNGGFSAYFGAAASTAAELTQPVNLTFDATGRITAASQSVTLNYGAGTTPITLDLGGSTQYANPFGVNSASQDGFAAGQMTGLSVGDDGVIQANYSNGRSRKAAQLVLATFANIGGLTNLGNNQWAVSAVSGDPLLDTPGNTDPKTSRGLGSVQGSAVEDANFDLGAELVALIVQQRYYQANAQSIKTQDQVLQTLAGIR